MHLPFASGNMRTNPGLETLKLSSSLLSYFICTYISVRGNEMHPKAAQVSRLRRQVHPFDLHHFISHPSLKGHNSFCIPLHIASGKHSWQSLETAFHFLTSHEEGQSLMLNSRTFSLHFSGIHSSGCHPSLLNAPFLHPINEMNSGHIWKQCWLRYSFRNIHTIMETITSARPEPKTDLVKQ